MSRAASEVLSQEFLQIRAKILEIAAFYDRYGAAEASNADDPQLDLLRQACQILCDEHDNKAAEIQLLFSREYDEHWRKQFGI